MLIQPDIYLLWLLALGAAPSYAPASNDDSLPLEILQNAFVESYGLKKYLPTIMQPKHFNFEQDNYPIYYSLQNPSTYVFSPKSRKISSTIFEMRELEHLMRIFISELSKDDIICSDTVISKAAKEVEFKYFHNEPDRHNVVKSSAIIPDYDARFNVQRAKKKSSSLSFASDAKFLRGCISIAGKS